MVLNITSVRRHHRRRRQPPLPNPRTHTALRNPKQCKQEHGVYTAPITGQSNSSSSAHSTDRSLLIVIHAESSTEPDFQQDDEDLFSPIPLSEV